MLAYMEDGDAAEVGLIGCEGVVGLPILLGADHDEQEAMVQASGTALRMDAAAFGRELDRVPGFRKHEFLSMMLGVRRPGIRVAAAMLQRAQLIRYERGRIEVIDSPGWRTPPANATASAVARTTTCWGRTPSIAIDRMGRGYESNGLPSLDSVTAKAAAKLALDRPNGIGNCPSCLATRGGRQKRLQPLAVVSEACASAGQHGHHP